MSERKYSDEFTFSFVLENFDGVRISDDGEGFIVECPVCKKEYLVSTIKIMQRIDNSKSYREGIAKRFPCSRSCRSKYITALPEVRKKLSESINSLKQKYGDDYFKNRGYELNKKILAKYGSYENLAKHNSEVYFAKTGYTHNMKNPESVRLNQTNRAKTIKEMDKEKKDLWSKRRFDTYRKNDSLFGNKRPFFKGRSRIADNLFLTLSNDALLSGLTLYFNATEKKFEGDSPFSHFFVDFYIEEYSIAIEFFGDYWHANPMLYEEDEKISYSSGIKSAKEIWQKDKAREEYLSNKYNMVFLHVWEKDVIDDFEKTFNNLKEEIKNAIGKR